MSDSLRLTPDEKCALAEAVAVLVKHCYYAPYVSSDGAGRIPPLLRDDLIATARLLLRDIRGEEAP